MRKKLEKYNNEIFKEIIGDWRPIDSMRLRISGLIKPKNINKLDTESETPEKIQLSGPELELYKLIRHMKPSVVVETGVQNGAATELILGALMLNEKESKLISFDIGADVEHGDICTKKTWDGEPGKLIRKEFQDKWTLVIGDSVEKMKEEFKDSVPFIDVFHHDSDHSNKHIEDELETIYPFMKPGGLICMHDRNGRTFSLAQDGRMKIIYLGIMDIWEVIKK